MACVCGGGVKKSGPHFSDRSYYDSIRVSVVKLHILAALSFLPAACRTINGMEICARLGVAG